jgi:hypothetical protein
MTTQQEETKTRLERIEQGLAANEKKRKDKAEARAAEIEAQRYAYRPEPSA